LPLHTRPMQKNSVKRTLLFLAFCCLTAAGLLFYLYKNYLPRRPKDTYKSFGINIPGNYSIHGIDISKYQENIRWDAVKQMKEKEVQLGFVFIKATQGADRVDETFNLNWYQARKYAMVRGAYHFYEPTQSGAAQARQFIKTVTMQPGDLPPVLDIEVTKNTDLKNLRKELNAWLKTIEAHYKVKPIIYTNAFFYTNILGKEYDAYPLWVAHYLEPNQPAVNRPWMFWQHSDKGRVNGIPSAVDFNVFNGDSVAFKALLLK